MAFTLKNPTDEAIRFLYDWRNSEPYIAAHTSGSTGQPKQILLSKADMILSAQATNRHFGIGNTSVLHCPLSVGYIAGKMMIVRALAADCTLVVEPPTKCPLEHHYNTPIDLIAAVPSQCPSIMNNRHAHKLIRNMIVGGAPIGNELEAALSQMPWNTYATYGMTETCSHVALRKIGNDFYKALPGICFDTDARGCLVVNAPAFSFKSLATNDVVELIDKTSFRWLGRYDNVINSGGVKFFPEQLESLIEDAIPYPFYIKGMQHPIYGEAVTLIIERPDLLDINDVRAVETEREQILQFCRSRMPRYAVPKAIVFVGELPRTPNGKIKR